MRFINNIGYDYEKFDGLTVDDLYIYCKNLLFDYWDNTEDKRPLNNAVKLAQKLVNMEENERAYNNYLFVLVNSRQYKKAFKYCSKIYNIGKNRDITLKVLSNKAFVEKGILDEEEYFKILKERLRYVKNEKEKRYVISLIKKEM